MTFENSDRLYKADFQTWEAALTYVVIRFLKYPRVDPKFRHETVLHFDVKKILSELKEILVPALNAGVRKVAFHGKRVELQWDRPIQLCAFSKMARTLTRKPSNKPRSLNTRKKQPDSIQFRRQHP